MAAPVLLAAPEEVGPLRERAGANRAEGVTVLAAVPAAAETIGASDLGGMSRLGRVATVVREAVARRETARQAVAKPGVINVNPVRDAVA